MSRIVLGDLLRGELGFSGVIVSDALDMAGASGSLGMAEAAVAALRAGCDLLCLGTKKTDAQLDDIELAVSGAVAEGTLAYDRVLEATNRVRGLAEDLQAARRAAGESPPFAGDWPGNGAELIHTFDVQPGASGWRARAAGRYAVIQLEADPNIAVGATPWGLLASMGPEPVEEWGPEPVEGRSPRSAFAAYQVRVISPERSALPRFQPGQSVLVVGRDVHQHPFARDVVDRLRSEHVDLLVVDMGWPGADRRYADVATFGASLLMARALMSWLNG
jgi:beta-N-acetylhexosaminidase